MRWTAYPLRPDTPVQGLSLEQLFADSDKNIDEMNARLKNAADEAGLPFGRRTMTFNSRFAQELGKWAKSKNKEDAFHDAVFKAYFVDGKNIGQIPVLIELAGSVGLSKIDARDVVENRTFKDMVDQDWSRSLQVDPEYIPSLMTNGNLLVNPQRYELFEQFMKANHVMKRD